MQKSFNTSLRNRSVLQALESRRLLSAGGLDTSFSGDGKVTLGLGNAAFANGMAVQSDGKIVEVGGRTITSGGSFVDTDVEMVRYNANGTLDTSFGSSHSGKIDFHYGSSGDNVQAEAVAIQADGKIVVAAANFRTNGQTRPKSPTSISPPTRHSPRSR